VRVIVAFFIVTGLGFKFVEKSINFVIFGLGSRLLCVSCVPGFVACARLDCIWTVFGPYSDKSNIIIIKKERIKTKE